VHDDHGTFFRPAPAMTMACFAGARAQPGILAIGSRL
jgi:hypothetical protein